MRNITTSIHSHRKKFMLENERKDHVIIMGHNNALFSAPHAVTQVRLGKMKYKEIGSVAVALYLAEKTGSYLIAKTKNNNDDANFDENSRYRDSISKLVESNGIKYLIDMHGLASHRPCDVNLGIHLGRNIATNVRAYDDLRKALKGIGLKVLIDTPYMAGSRTISGWAKNKYPDLWTIQIEINCSITNSPDNAEKLKSLLQILTNWVSYLQ